MHPRRALTTLTTFAALAAYASAPALAIDDHAGHHTSSSSRAPASTALADGTVKKVDKDAGKLTISHGPIASLDMPPMTMVFHVADAAMLDQLKRGDKIRFAADRVSGVFTVTVLEKAQ